MAKSNNTLQSVVNLAATHADLLPLTGVGGYTNEPALSLCNDTLQELLATEQFPWKSNRVRLDSGSGIAGTPYGSFIVTQQNKQDYLFAGAVAFTTNGGVGIGLASNNAITQTGAVTTVNTLETHPFAVGDTVYLFGCTVAGYNSALSQTASAWTYTGGYTITAITATSFTFTANASGLGNSGAPGITDFGWIESGSMVEINNNSPLKNTKIVRGVRNIPPSPRVDNPKKIALVTDNYDGTLLFRVGDCPGGTIWGINLVYQAKAPTKTAMTGATVGDWSPFPDELAFVYRNMFLARCWRYLATLKPQFEGIAERAEQVAQAMIIKGLGIADAEESEEFIAPDRNLVEF